MVYVLGGGLGVGFGAGSAYYNARRGGYNAWTGRFTEKSIRGTYDIPNGWNAEPAGKGDGIKFVDPKNRHNYYRFMNDNPGSQNPWQQNMRIEIKIDGHNFDAVGNQLPSQAHPNSHIQIDKSPKIFIRKPFLD